MNLYIYAGLSFLIALLIGKPFIAFLYKLKSTQKFRELGPQSHIETKSGTPTMGGWIFLIPIILGIIMLYLETQSQSVLLIGAAIVIGALMGAADDSIKILQSNYKGLNSKQKLIIQFLASSAISYFSGRYLFASFNPYVPEWLAPLLVPGEFIWAFLVIAGASNAINLSDGLDGLATILSIIAFGTFGIHLWMHGDLTLVTLSIIIVFSLLGFLIFNFKPAKVFMGDTGSLALGMGLGALAYITDLEWYLLVFALVPVIETISVILQVLSAKLSRKYLGKDIRLFKMAPLHHHFELSGWSEIGVVIIFAGFQLLVSVLFIYFYH